MKKQLSILIVMLMLTGCAASQNAREHSATSAAATEESASAEIPESEPAEEIIVFSESIGNSFITLEYTVYSEKEDKTALSANNYVELSTNGEVAKRVFFANPVTGGMGEKVGVPYGSRIKTDVVKFDDYLVVSFGLPYRPFAKDETEYVSTLFYASENSLQMLGDGRFFPSLTEESKFTVDYDNETFSFSDIDGNEYCLTVGLDENDAEHFILIQA